MFKITPGDSDSSNWFTVQPSRSGIAALGEFIIWKGHQLFQTDEIYVVQSIKGIGGQ